MKSSFAAGLAGFLLLGQALATDTCSPGATNVFSTNACCAPTGRIKHRRASGLERRTTCDGGAAPCCTAKGNGPTKVTSSSSKANLQCGSKYGDNDPRDKDAAITYSIVPCPTDGTKLCFHVHVESANAEWNDPPNLQIEADASKLVSTALGNWEFNNKCSETTTTTVDCDVPLDLIYPKFPAPVPTSLSDLCGKKLYVAIAVHVASDPGLSADEATCTSQGTDLPGNNWFMYSTVEFECPEICTAECCCQTQTPQFHWCDLGTAFGYNKDLFHNFNGNPTGPALTPNPNTCKRWGWYYSLTPGQLNSALIGDLIVGAGGNDVSKGIDVGDFTATLSGTTLTVGYTLTGDYELSSVHIYASCTIPGSCAPGSYTFPGKGTAPDLSGTNDKTFSTTITVGTCSTYYFIFHANVNVKYPLDKDCSVPIV